MKNQILKKNFKLITFYLFIFWKRIIVLMQFLNKKKNKSFMLKK